MNTHGATVLGGKYTGQLLTRVPVGYLRWAIVSDATLAIRLGNGTVVDIVEAAKAEIERRGDRLQSIDLSAHAVDRFSLRHLDYWRLRREAEEGIYSFMQRKALEAWDRRALPGAKPPADNVWRIEHEKVTWVIEYLAIPVVKTVL